MPSFSIEAPGEANPLTENLLVRSLTSAASSDPNQIQTGTKQLQEWEKAPGYYRHLQGAYLDSRLPLEIRYLAIIQLKNGVDKYWRKTATNAVPKQDKDVIRSHLLESALNEPDNRLAVQNALLIAKIARFEYPHDWPDALSALTQILRSQVPPLQLARALLVLLHIVKELSTGRLQRTRQNLQVATPEILHVLGSLYASLVESWRTNHDDTLLQQALLAIKVLRRLMVAGYDHPNRHSEAAEFWRLTQEHLASFISLLQQGRLESSLVEKHTVQLAKLHHEMAREHPAAFVLLPGSFELIRSYWGLITAFGETFGSKSFVLSSIASAKIGADGDIDSKEDNVSAEKLALKGLLILRACVKMVHSPATIFKHRTPEDKEEKATATTFISQNLLTPDFVREVVQTIVSRYFVFRASDLREWEEEPEEWEKREEGDGEDWEFSIRSCSEKLFLDLAIFYKEMLVQPLLQAFYSVANPESKDVLFKDSVYTAIGLAAPILHEHLDFNAFIQQVLLTEVQKEEPGYGIIRRRAAILLGQWISVKVSHQVRPAVYQIFEHLLDKSDALNDQVVRVTAGRQFKNVCDDWDFDAEQFMPYAETTLVRLMQLIDEVELTETKMALLDTISNAVIRLEHRIAPYAERIVNMLPPLWERSGDEHLMKQAILTILTRLVNALKADGLPLHALAFPIIRGAVEPGSETSVYLLDDAMDLWADIVVQSPAPASADLLSLIPYLYSIYELGSENLRKALEITESYVLLAPDHILAQKNRSHLLTALSGLLGSLKPDANGLVCNLLETIVRATEQVHSEQMNQLELDFVNTDVLGKLLRGLQGSWTAHCTTGPLRKEPPVDGIVETDYFAVLARLLLGSTPGFLQAVESAAPHHQSKPSSLDSTMQWVLEEWFSHFENVGDPARRKLMCLALTRLLDTNQRFILVNLQSLMTMWTDVVVELRNDNEDIAGDSLVYNSEASHPNDGSLESPEDGRRRQWMYSDVVHQINLPAFIKQHLEQAIHSCGGMETFQQEWLVNVDKDVLAAFSELRII